MTPADEGIAAAKRDAYRAANRSDLLEDARLIVAKPENHSWSAHLDPDQHHDLYRAITWLAGVFEEEGIGPGDQHEESEAAEGALRRAIQYLKPEQSQ
ncbi:hypothetical protein LCGC14_0929990 [marine sediment metagenome]|uniref:Uncharacterized protein n=1 Tax=marine sediment metagenome TaxID=412755 RepID=A0A0F9NSR3_9ZZZZ